MNSSPSKQRELAALQDMLESAKRIAEYTAGIEFEHFWDNSEKRDAVALRLANIGEAAKRITKKTETEIPGIPFDEIRGMRNRIAHEYSMINFRIVWKITRENIPALIQELENYFSKIAD